MLPPLQAWSGAPRTGFYAANKILTSLTDTTASNATGQRSVITLSAEQQNILI